MTIIAVAIVAYAVMDVVHEAGHALASRWLGVRILSISTVALQTARHSRLLATAGTLADVIAGAWALLIAASRRRFDSTTYFLWLFGFVSLMNVGYLVFSAVTNTGDWAAVIAGLEPRWAWRLAIGAVGIAAYWLAIRLAVTVMRMLIDRAGTSSSDASQLTYLPYLAGGALMIIASIFNPLGPWLILMSGAGASLGLTWGLLLVRPMLRNARGASESSTTLPLEPAWILLAVVVGVGFVAILGPGIPR
jgi:hypothetical protein